MMAFSLVEGDIVVRSSDGIELAVEDAAALPTDTRGFVSVGYDGVNTRFIRVNSSGHQYILSNQLPSALVGGRLDTNIGSWFGSTSPTVGQKVMASSIPVALASDQSALPVSQNGSWTVQQGTPPWSVEGTDANGVAPTENPVLVAGWDATNTRIILTDTSGRVTAVGAGTAGSPVGGVVSIQGVSGGQDVDVSQGSAAPLTGAWPVRLISNNLDMGVGENAAIPAGTRALLVAAEDAGGNSHYLSVDGAHNLRVTSIPPVPPATATEVAISQDDTYLEINSTHDTEYTIPNGETFYLQTVVAGAAGDPSEKGSKVEVVYDDGTTEHTVTRIYVGGQTVAYVLPDVSKARDGTTMVGDGSTKKIILRRDRLSGASEEVDAEVRGYVQ